MSNFKAKCTKFDFRLGSAPALPQTTQLYLTGPTSKGKEKEEEGGVEEDHVTMYRTPLLV